MGGWGRERQKQGLIRAIAIIQAGEDNGLEKGGDNGDDEKYSDSEYIQKIEPAGHAMGEDIVMWEKRSQSLMILAWTTKNVGFTELRKKRKCEWSSFGGNSVQF